jgi:hypothetical protein
LSTRKGVAYTTLTDLVIVDCTQTKETPAQAKAREAKDKKKQEQIKKKEEEDKAQMEALQSTNASEEFDQIPVAKENTKKANTAKVPAKLKKQQGKGWKKAVQCKGKKPGAKRIAAKG